MAELAVVGVSHHSAPIEVRERVALSAEAAQELAREIAAAGAECVCLSTCNRTELYIAGEGGEDRAVAALEPEVGDLLMRRADDAAVLHLFRVVAGLDSLVRGEQEILGQVREAYALGASGPVLDRLFHQALHVGRRVRAETTLGQSAASVSSAAVELAGEVRGRRVLVIGAGRIGEQTARSLVTRGADVVVANRSLERARRVAATIGARPLPVEEIGAELGRADIVVSSTASPELVLTRAAVEAALGDRSDAELVVIDLAVPRDVDPAVATLPGCTVYDIDDLPSEELGGAVAEAERIVGEEAERFDAWVASRGVAPAIASLRARAEEIRRGELDKAEGRLSRLSPEDRRAVEALTAQIVNKLLHPPTVRLKEAADDGDGGLYADAVRHLFALDAHPARLARQ